MKGTVKFFNERKNYGFISPEGPGQDHFVHRSDIESGTLNEGDIVEFDSKEGEKGPRAVNVKKIK
ncbi:cold-shock protein [candidate division MSBL1 archaeon SCGC-AAA261F19]|uniref:Cold-shock protein n=2 Tax=candidate division MSBL1 TaxID=215777 RepID=A0A133V9B9_9EURY|nr:cold-shock protein [candidate division MSBL1 archaeon SCGC-AAA261D19]KXB02987.1 cold-shock protein [candidate division MSBL1 archaeon SCGC-AAA261F19]